MKFIQRQAFFVTGTIFMRPRFLRHSLFGLVLVLAASVTPAGFAADDGQVKQSLQLSVTSHTNVSPVVELYTSEGCSSCPKADNFMTELGRIIERADEQEFHAVPLAFHVDYWNRLGWVDPYSKPEFTARQQEVGDNNNQRSIYTPEFVVAGKETRGGSDVVKRIKKSNRQMATVDISLNLQAPDSDKLEVDFTIENHTAESDALAYVAIYENDIVREIAGGENKGRTLIHNYVVRHWSDPIRLSSGITNKTTSLKIERDWVRENLGFAVVVVKRENGETIQALNTSLDTLFPI